MRVTRVDGRLVVLDRPGFLRPFGIALVCTGTIVLFLPFVSYGWDVFEWNDRASLLLIGASHFLAGLWMAGRQPSTRTELDRVGGVGTHRVRRTGMAEARVTRFSLGEVRSVEVLQDRDANGGSTFQVRLWLDGGRVLALQAYPSPGERAAHEWAASVRDYLGVKTPGNALARLR
jgi:hypothetical protein